VKRSTSFFWEGLSGHGMARGNNHSETARRLGEIRRVGAHSRRELPRTNHDVVIQTWASQAIVDLNTDLCKDPTSAEMVVEDVLTTFTSAADGLVAANERMTVMLRGEHPFVDAHGQHVPRGIIDFVIPRANKLVVANEVTIGAPGSARRFDVVY
jgi:type I restriction enzyme, R subunit